MFSPSPPPPPPANPFLHPCWMGWGVGVRSLPQTKVLIFQRKFCNAKTEPTSGVGAVATVTSLPQHHLTILSEDMKKQPPPPPPISPERCPWQRKASRAYSNSIDTSHPACTPPPPQPTHPLPSVCPPQSCCDEAFISPPPPPPRCRNLHLINLDPVDY